MLPYSNKSNASKGALRFATKTGKPHTVKHTDAGWIVVPVEVETPAVTAALAAAETAPREPGHLMVPDHKPEARKAAKTPQVAPIAGMTPLGKVQGKRAAKLVDAFAVSPEEALAVVKANDAQRTAGQDRMQGGKRAAALAAAQAGQIPAAPDFTAATHKPYRAKLAALTALVAAGDIAGLRAFQINPTSSSPKALARYRDQAVLALTASAAAQPARQAGKRG